MQRKFEGKDEQTEIENLLFTYLEDVKRKTIEQQEVVLKHQTDLKIMMEMHQNEKQSLRDEFDKYCLQKYGTLLADANMTIILVILCNDDFNSITVCPIVERTTCDPNAK